MLTNVEWQARLDKLFPDGGAVSTYRTEDIDPDDPGEWEPSWTQYCPRPYCVAVDADGFLHIGVWAEGSQASQYVVPGELPLVVNAAGVNVLTLDVSQAGKTVMTSRIPPTIAPSLLKTKDAVSLMDIQEGLGLVW